MPHYYLNAETLNNGEWTPVNVHSPDGFQLFHALARKHANGLLKLNEAVAYGPTTTARLVQVPNPASARPTYDELTTFPNSTRTLVRAAEFLPCLGLPDSYVVRYRFAASAPFTGCRAFDTQHAAIEFQARHEAKI